MRRIEKDQRFQGDVPNHQYYNSKAHIDRGLSITLKREGERLYEKARRGEKVEIQSRKVTINQFNITSVKNLNVSFEIKCSKGTYIRSIANDFGTALNSGGYLSKLCRTAIGKYQLTEGINIESFEKFLNT